MKGYSLRISGLASVVSLGLMGCAGGIQDPSRAPQDSSSAINSSSTVVQGTNDGTSLTATAALSGGVQCTSQDGGTVTVTGMVESTGGIDAVTITASVNGGAAVQVGTIQPQDFTVHDERYKDASYSVPVSVPNGTDNIQMCFTQAGSDGRPSKSTCAPPLTVTAACQTSCDTTGVFGDLVGNPSLCKGNGPPHIPVHVKGDFGDSAALTITGPSSYSLQATLRHAGDSCVYQYNWDASGNGGAGTYSFAVVGANGHTYSFTADLHCR